AESHQTQIQHVEAQLAAKADEMIGVHDNRAADVAHCNTAPAASPTEDFMISNKQEHETSGTARRGAHQMSGRGLVFRVADEVDKLRDDLQYTSGGRAAKTLAKSEGLRITLVLIKKDFELNPEA